MHNESKIKDVKKKAYSLPKFCNKNKTNYFEDTFCKHKHTYKVINIG